MLSETKVIIGDDVLLEVGINSDWYIRCVTYNHMPRGLITKEEKTVTIELAERSE